MSIEIEQLRIESNLSERFSIHTYPNGSRIVAANGYVMDYAMFSCMLIWLLGGSVCYITHMSKNDRMITRTKQLNPNVVAIQSLDGYALCKHVFSKVGRMLSNSSKQELIDLMSSALDLKPDQYVSN